jgi:3-hydroxyacyl-CoA dehydrogenase/3a,7a,12a-trihydroxy-5b-cholest-24-enoyl-CoA hydratase
MINEVTTFVRGAGGWGGDRGPSADVNVPPDRAPDAVVEEKTDDHQALLYRLSGDWNPLHADPGFAQAFGFDRPILHGLCSFGYAGRHVLSAFAPGGDARYFESIKVRFADSVFPGETLVTEMWKDGDRRVVFRTKVKERDKVVLSNAAVEFFETLPRAKPKPEALAKGGAKAGTAQGPAEVTTADVFHGLGRFVEAHPELVDKVQKVFQFAITSPDSVWTVDLKNGRGAVVAGAEPAPDTTLELSNDDWLCMIRGEADPQKLYFGGKLKIGGDVMASQKLEFLKKVDPSFVTDAMRDRLGGAVASAGDPGTGGPAAQASRSADVFVGIQIYVEQHPELAERVKSVFLFKLTDPVSAWTIDLKSGGGSVQPGEVGVADCTLELAESDFMAMTRGEADPQKLYFGGKLKISGNVMASQKLDFLTKIDPKAVASEVAKRKAAGTAASAPVAPKAARTKVAKAVFDKLAKRLEEHPELAQEVGVRIELVVDEERAIVDLRSSPGTVEHRSATDGAAADGVSPAAVLSLTDIDFEALVSGAESAQSLYQRGRLRVDGDVTVAHRLGFLKQLA